MRHFSFLAFALLCGAACANLPTATLAEETDGPRLDGGPVEVPEDDGGTPGPGNDPAPSCIAYCDLVMQTCSDESPQYRSSEECLAFCSLLPLGDAADTDTAAVGCRHYYAGSPARTDAVSYCPAAGPYGGNVCGDRCTAFCQIALGACAPDGGVAPFESYAACQTACAGYAFMGDAGSDSGKSESPAQEEDGDAAPTGNTLDCRLHYLRDAVLDPAACEALLPTGPCQ